MICLFSSNDLRSGFAAVFCVTLFACQSPARPPSTGGAQSDPVAEHQRSQTLVMTPANDASDLPQETQTNASFAIEDPRPQPRFESKPRARALLVTELQALQHLAAATPVTAPDHPQIARRIAEDFVELERAAKNEGSAEMQITARNKAISAYAKLVEDHPDYAQLDEALYDLATEYERAGDWDLALSTYQRVLRDPPPSNNLYGYAWYEVGWVLRNKGDVDGARQAFNEAIAYATEYASAPGSAKLAEASRNDLRAL